VSAVTDRERWPTRAPMRAQGFALAVPEADAVVADAVRRPGGCAGGFAGAHDRGSERS
jgi:hypothetical protein